MSNEDNVLNGCYAGCIGALMVAQLLCALFDCDVGTLWHKYVAADFVKRPIACWNAWIEFALSMNLNAMSMDGF